MIRLEAFKTINFEDGRKIGSLIMEKKTKTSLTGSKEINFLTPATLIFVKVTIYKITRSKSKEEKDGLEKSSSHTRLQRFPPYVKIIFR